MTASREAQASFRDSPWRLPQRALQGITPLAIDLMYKGGWFKDTKIAEVLGSGGEVLPDDVTLSGLQITINAVNTLMSSGHKGEYVNRTILGGAMDVFDGSLARHKHMASPEGAVKDVLADRISELYMAKVIYENRKRYDGCPNNLEHSLKAAFQYSTVTKAFSEMSGVHTSEGGLGSMIERRRVLLITLFDLGILNNTSNEFFKQKLLHDIDENNRFLINGSLERARMRTKRIVLDRLLRLTHWDNLARSKSDSPAAVEARKYVAVVMMNKREGLDIVRGLNGLTHRKIYPAAESLLSNYPYIYESQKETKDFLKQALSIARLS